MPWGQPSSGLECVAPQIPETPDDASTPVLTGTQANSHPAGFRSGGVSPILIAGRIGASQSLRGFFPERGRVIPLVYPCLESPTFHLTNNADVCTGLVAVGWSLMADLEEGYGPRVISGGMLPSRPYSLKRSRGR